MPRAFRKRGSGEETRYVAGLDAVERQVTVELLQQVRELLAGDEDRQPNASADTPGDASPDSSRPQADPFDEIVAGLGPIGSEPPPGARSHGPRDPALERLLPAAHRDDPEAAEEFRRLTEGGLRRRKVATIDTAIRALTRPHGRVELTETDAVALLVGLTDVRLVIGERLGLREDGDAEELEVVIEGLPPEHPARQAYVVYDFLTWLQEGLAQLLLPGP